MLKKQEVNLLKAADLAMIAYGQILPVSEQKTMKKHTKKRAHYNVVQETVSVNTQQLDVNAPQTQVAAPAEPYSRTQLHSGLQDGLVH